MAVIRRPSPRRVERDIARHKRQAQKWYIDRALEDVAQLGYLTSWRRKWLAKRTGVGQRQARRLVAQGGHRGRARLTIDGERLEVLWDVRGNVSAAADRLGIPRSTFSDNTLLDVSDTERAQMRDGDIKQRAAELNLPQFYAFGDLWAFDVKQVSTWVRCPVTDKAIQPLVGHTKCLSTKVLVGAYPLERDFATADVVDAIKYAIQIRPAEGPFGGTPKRVRLDNAPVHLSGEFFEFLYDYDLEHDPIPDHRPDVNGGIESFFNFVECRFAAATRFYADRPVQFDGEPQLELGTLPTWDEFCADYANFIYDYNHEHKHRTIGTTPARKWAELAREQAKALANG